MSAEFIDLVKHYWWMLRPGGGGSVGRAAGG